MRKLTHSELLVVYLLVRLYRDHQYYDDSIAGHAIETAVFAKILAQRLELPEDDVVDCYLGALGHDPGAAYYGRDNHHAHGARMLRRLLSAPGLGFDNQRIRRIVGCVAKHRSSIAIPRRNIIEEIVAFADVLSHLSRVRYLVAIQTRKGKTLAEAKKIVAIKLEKDREKVPAIFIDDFEAAFKNAQLRMESMSEQDLPPLKDWRMIPPELANVPVYE